MRVVVIGAGAWGTALAAAARRAGNDVLLWARSADIAEAIAGMHQNPAYLPGVTLDPAITAGTDPALAAGADAVILAVPAQYLRGVLVRLAPHVGPATPAILCAKGVERDSGALMTEVAAALLPGRPVAVLSGPTFAAEVVAGKPTAATLHCADAAIGAMLRDRLATPALRLYLGDDPVGAELGGAVKNVLAIACGITEGRALGENARAALITRGLAEITRLAVARGGRAETLMGLAGLGDVVLTCTSGASRNYALGLALGRGATLEDALAGRRAVVEGVATAAALVALAARHKVEMPIAAAVDAILHHGLAIDAAIDSLLARPLANEGVAF